MLTTSFLTPDPADARCWPQAVPTPGLNSQTYGFPKPSVPTPGSNSGLRKKFARFRPERHFPRSAGWEGREVLVLIRTVCSQLMGFAKTCMTQPGFEPATFAFQTAAKTARLRKLLLQTRAACNFWIYTKHDPARVRTRDLHEPKPKPNACEMMKHRLDLWMYCRGMSRLTMV